MLDQLEAAYHKLVEHAQADAEDERRLMSIVDDLRWYADRLGTDRWYKQPRSNKWSFEQNLWYFTKQASAEPALTLLSPLSYFIDRGKECVGLAAEIIALFEYGESY